MLLSGLSLSCGVAEMLPLEINSPRQRSECPQHQGRQEDAKWLHERAGGIAPDMPEQGPSVDDGQAGFVPVLVRPREKSPPPMLPRPRGLVDVVRKEIARSGPDVSERVLEQLTQWNEDDDARQVEMQRHGALPPLGARG